ncbi:MAG TPA: riboflavin biosynthesis protein RibF [Gaiellaceae bacterium]|nr:riboflavin biosynthesis protein RibF [Gaiellaceae bacterium]
MNVVHDAARLDAVPRAVAIGTFDGVHLGHRAVVRAAVDSGLWPTVVTFDPHPRLVFGKPVELLASLQRRLELLAECGVEDVLVVPFTAEIASLEAESFARDYLLAIGTQVVVAGAGFRFGRGREGDLALLERLGIEARPVPLVEGISSTRIRDLLRAGDVEHAAQLLGRPVEVEGEVVVGDSRGTGLGFPTANISTVPNLIVPADGIYAGAAGSRRAAVSIGPNPHFGSHERRVEAYLIDWQGDLYGERLVVQVWQRLRDSRAFLTDEELSEQIARDVEETRAATPPR